MDCKCELQFIPPRIQRNIAGALRERARHYPVVTVAGDFLRPLHRFLPEAEGLRRLLVFGGEAAGRRSGVRIVPWREIQGVRWA